MTSPRVQSRPVRTLATFASCEWGTRSTRTKETIAGKPSRTTAAAETNQPARQLPPNWVMPTTAAGRIAEPPCWPCVIRPSPGAGLNEPTSNFVKAISVIIPWPNKRNR
jgi:hypothetical protein